MTRRKRTRKKKTRKKRTRRKRMMIDCVGEMLFVWLRERKKIMRWNIEWIMKIPTTTHVLFEGGQKIIIRWGGEGLINFY
jgi:hypothetical protein